MMFLAMICSRILQQTDVSEIGAETSCNMQKKKTFYIHYNMDFEKAFM
jgi:hypothetical protein